ncbi:MAG TPA: hypothetical protein DCQ53_13015 [Alphaproteobacteria bacterium]|jgi:hypothetical protein|nr:hypothetical protein [Alphaproteobacteria bacterium]
MAAETRTSDIQREHAAERAAIWRAFIAYAAIILGFWVVNSLSNITEAERAGDAVHAGQAWFLEGSSASIIIALFWGVAWLEARAPVGEARWAIAVPVHLAGSLVFSAVHVAWIAGVRDTLWPLLFEGDYRFFADGVGLVFLYEYRKDVMAYAVILFLLYVFRSVERHKMEAGAARREAQSRHRVTLKCGGRTVFAEASDFFAAKAAGNYVEARFGAREILARMTLTELEALLTEAGVDAVRTHRSFLVNRAAISETVPTGEGDVRVVLSNGKEVPGSRRYREGLGA